MTKRGRSEDPDFLKELQQFVPIRVWDELCEGFYEYLDNNIDAFPRLDNSQLRVAQTATFFRDSKQIPHLEIWFRVSEDDSTLILWGVTKKDDYWDEEFN